MPKFKKSIAFLLTACLLFPLFARSTYAVEAEEGVPSVSAQSAVLIEAASGTVVASKDAHKLLPMASTTKIMTAVTALSLASSDTRITVTEEAVGVEGSSIYLLAGEVLTLEQLLYALMLESANDAAVAIAVGLCGSVEQFAAEMNRLAGEWGLKCTHFVNPHGLDDEEHYTTAYELARITQKLLENELLCTIVSTQKTTIPHAEADGTRYLANHNKLLRLYDDCVGVKTGFTKRSGRCLVSAATREGVTMIAVTLNAPDDWNDHMSLLDYGFTQFSSVLLCEGEELTYSVPVVGGTTSMVAVCNLDDACITLPTAHGEITQTVELPRFAYAAIGAGELMGRVVFFCDTDRDGKAEQIGEVALYSCHAVEQTPRKKSFWQWLKGLFGIK